MRSTSEMRKILRYFRRLASAGREPPDGGTKAGDLRPPLAEMPGESDTLFMASAALFENAGDHLVQGRVLHAHVHDRVLVENQSEHLGNPAAIHFQIHLGPDGPDNFPKYGQIRWHA